MRHVWTFVIGGLGLTIGLGAMGPGASIARTLPAMSIDAAKIQGAETCRECHAAAYAAWENSTHFATFKDRHRTAEADAILQKMDLSSMKRNEVCITCHYTPQMVEGSARPMSGVSCESCHGPGLPWTNEQLHHESASKAATPAAREEILVACERVGMLRPSNVARVARNCYGCHTVPNEQLVNIGGHPAGSPFELVSWSQGEVRHNYQQDEGTNRTPTADRLRVLYVVGAITDLEYTLRGYAAVTERGAYRTALQRRKNESMARLDAVAGAVDIPELTTVINALPRDDKGRLKVGRSLLEKLPGELAATADTVATSYDGSTLAGVDSLIPASRKGTAQP